MWKRLRARPHWMLGLGVTMGLLVGVGMLIGALAALPARGPATLAVPETLLHATATHSGETMAMATGYVDSEVEGLFILDYLTGELQCWVMYPRTFTFGGMFKRNVIADLGLQQGKKASYVLVTGQAEMQRGTAMMGRPASCICYVADQTSGAVAAYSFLWNPQGPKTNTPQAGEFRLLATGKARALAVRDQE